MSPSSLTSDTVASDADYGEIIRLACNKLGLWTIDDLDYGVNPSAITGNLAEMQMIRCGRLSFLPS